MDGADDSQFACFLQIARFRLLHLHLMLWQ